MLTPELCDRLSYEDRPRIDITALLELRRLIDALRVDRGFESLVCAESASGGQDAEQQGKSHRIARKLRFEEEEIWTALPESTRGHCRGLWRQLLESVLNDADRRPNERED